MKSEKTSCRNCFGAGQVEQGSSGPVDCVPCKGSGQVEIVRKVDHYEDVLFDDFDSDDVNKYEQEN